VRTVNIGPDAAAGPGLPLLVIAGPCVLESRDLALEVALRLKEITARLGMGYVFKASFDKANRTSLSSFRGPGLEKGLAVLAEVAETAGVPVVSDVHETWQVEPAAEVLDLIQIPAFLCRQTDLLVAAAKSGRPVNLKKGQFLAPEDMAHVVEKARVAGAEDVLVTERGTTFGYHDLVVDLRGLPVLAGLGVPVCFDATHSVQRPAGEGARTGGDRRLAPVLARAAAAVGIDALFAEVHESPDEALSDGPNSLTYALLEGMLDEVLAVRRALAEVRGAEASP
jgi:2-dehydro-3-deoxyphosphooctonate aldolase (KDO 8-P synthase)